MRPNEGSPAPTRLHWANFVASSLPAQAAKQREGYSRPLPQHTRSQGPDGRGQLVQFLRHSPCAQGGGGSSVTPDVRLLPHHVSTGPRQCKGSCKGMLAVRGAGWSRCGVAGRTHHVVGRHLGVEPQLALRDAGVAVLLLALGLRDDAHGVPHLLHALAHVTWGKGEGQG